MGTIQEMGLNRKNPSFVHPVCESIVLGDLLCQLGSGNEGRSLAVQIIWHVAKNISCCF